MTEPTTEAGRALLTHFAIGPWTDARQRVADDLTAPQFVAGLLAIESEAAAAERERGLDVDRLAQALQDSDLMRRYREYADAIPTMRPTPMHTLCIEWATAIAREYAAAEREP